MTPENLLSSTAKQKVVETLYKYKQPVHIRRIITLSGLLPRSIQLALKALCEAELVIKKQERTIQYFLNKNHKSYDFISQIYKTKIENEIENRVKNYLNLSSSISFIEDAKKLVRSIKSMQ